MAPDPYWDRICAVCRLSFGAHRADAICRNQCPGHEGRMDWPSNGITTFVDSGEAYAVPPGTPSGRQHDTD
jgi:hypothetical protein